jgi:hypothetical protein
MPLFVENNLCNLPLFCGTRLQIDYQNRTRWNITDIIKQCMNKGEVYHLKSLICTCTVWIENGNLKYQETIFMSIQLCLQSGD